MAIIEDLGLEVEILVDDLPLREYKDEEEDPTDDTFGDETRKCRRYVEVVEDAEFAVQVCVTPANDYLNENEHLLFIVDLDGQEDLGDCQLKSTTENLIEGKYEHDGQTLVLRKFRFTTVATVDDDDKERVHRDEKTARCLGLIRVRVFRVKAIEDKLPFTPGHTPEFDEVEDELAEKALKGKALSHRTGLSAPIPTDDFSMTEVEYVDPRDAPFAVFYFKYRSRAALQDEMIIPRSREASPQPSAIENLSFPEIRRLAIESVDRLPFHEIIRMARTQSSSTREESSASLRTAVKREQSESQSSDRPRKIGKISGGREVVDLTDDD